MDVTNATALPIPGTPAYGAAQREAVALVQAGRDTELAPDEELDLLRRIAAHGFASRMMAAHGADVARWIMILETLRELFEDDDEEDDEVADPDGPPRGSDWCRRGCQVRHGMECGMCGYDGPGVWADQVDTVAEYCCHCKARTYQSQEGICTLCGKDAETPDAQGAAAEAGPAAPTPGVVDGER